MVSRWSGETGSNAQPKIRPMSMASTRPFIGLALSCSDAASGRSAGLGHGFSYAGSSAGSIRLR